MTQVFSEMLFRKRELTITKFSWTRSVVAKLCLGIGCTYCCDFLVL